MLLFPRYGRRQLAGGMRRWPAVDDRQHRQAFLRGGGGGGVLTNKSG